MNGSDILVSNFTRASFGTCLHI